MTPESSKLFLCDGVLGRALAAVFHENEPGLNTVAWETPAGTEYLLGSGGFLFIPRDLYSGVEDLVDAQHHAGGAGA